MHFEDKLNITFAPLKEDDFETLFRWLQESHVKKWWKDKEFGCLNTIIEKYSPYLENKNGVWAFIVSIDGKKIGFIQYYFATPGKTDGAGIDFYIGEKEYLNKGISNLIIKDFLDQKVFKLFKFCIADPDKKNIYAIRTLEKAGFTVHSKVEDFIIMVNTA
jgi:aminoglycoside 6'-N-acetyltransferase